MKTDKIAFKGDYITKNNENIKNEELKSYFSQKGEAQKFVKKDLKRQIFVDIYTNENGRISCRFLDGNKNGDRLFSFFIHPETQPQVAKQQFETVAMLTNAFFKRIKGGDMADAVRNSVRTSLESIKELLK